MFSDLEGLPTSLLRDQKPNAFNWHHFPTLTQAHAIQCAVTITRISNLILSSVDAGILIRSSYCSIMREALMSLPGFYYGHGVCVCVIVAHT